MRARITVVVLLFGVLIAMPWLAPALADSPSAHGTLRLISLGLILLTATVAGDLFDHIGIPRISAYLITGLAFGGHTLEVLNLETLGTIATNDATQSMSLLTITALSLIAFRTGTAVRFEMLRSQLRPTLTLVGSQLAMLTVVITIAVVVLGTFTGAVPHGVNASTATLIALGLTLSVLSFGAAPVSTVAVRDECGSRGPLGHMLVSTSVLREMLLPVLLALLLPLAWSLDGAWNVAWSQVLFEVFLSIGVGFACGGLLLLIRRVTKHETPLLTLTIIFTVSVLCLKMGPHGAMILFLVAGVTLRNASPQMGMAVMTSLEPLATPVYVIFFVAAGASYPMVAAAGALPLAITLAIARCLALGLSGPMAHWLSKDTPPSFRLLGLGSMPHLGVTLGMSILVGMVIPVWGPIIRDAIFGSILLTEVIGPFLVRSVLIRSSEAPDRWFRRDQDTATPEVTPFERIVETGPDLPIVPDTLPAEIAQPLSALRSELQGEIGQFADTVAEALASGPFSYVQSLTAACEEDDERERPDVLRKWARLTMSSTSQDKTADTLGAGVTAIINGLDAIASKVRPTSTPETPASRSPLPSDGRIIRLQKWWLRLLVKLGLRRKPRRIVRLDRLVRYHLTMPLPKHLVPLSNMALRAPILAIEDAGRLLSSEEGDLRPAATIVENLQRLGDDVLARGMLIFSDAMEAIYKDAALAGTPSLPERRYNPSRRFQENRTAREGLDRNMEHWSLLTRALGSFLILRIEVELVEPRILSAFDQGLTSTRSTVEQFIQLPIQRIGVLAKEAQSRVTDTLNKADEPTAMRAIEEARDQLLSQIESMERDLDIRRDRGQLTGFLRLLWGTLSRVCGDLPDQLTVPSTDRVAPPEGLAPAPSEYATSELRVREVAKAAVVDHCMLNLVEMEGKLNDLVSLARAELTQAAQILRFHLDAATTELANKDSKEPKELAREFALEGLERVIEHSTEVLSVLEERREELVSRMEEERNASIDRLRALLTVEPPDKAMLYLAQYRRRERPAAQPSEAMVEEPTGFKNSLTKRMGALAPWRVEEPGDAIVVAERFPFDTASNATLAHAADLGVPQTYLRLFGFDPVGLGDFFTGRQAEGTSLWHAFERWKSGGSTSILVTGKRGDGCTSLVEQFLRQMPTEHLDKTVRIRLSRRISTSRALVREISTALGLRRVGSVARLIEHLNNWPHPILFFLEPLGRLHIRHRGGVGALSALRRIIGETAHRVLWVVCTHTNTLKTINTLVPIEDAFTHHIQLAPMDATELQALVEIRHQASGYRLEYRTSDGTPMAQNELRTQFFAEMNRQCHGLPLLGVYHWLRSIRVEPHSRDVFAQAPSPLDLDFVDELSMEELILLAQVHVHEGLTANELSRLDGWTHNEAREALRSLTWKHLVTVDPHEMHAVNPIIWAQLQETLEQRSILG